jgi:hypothetical protein
MSIVILFVRKLFIWAHLGGQMNECVFFLEISGGGEEPKQIFIVSVCAMWDQRQISFILL